MKCLKILVGLALLLFGVPAFAQIGCVLQLPPNADVAAIAANAGGAVVDAMPDVNQILLSVPNCSPNSPPSGVTWQEPNASTTFPSNPHPAYLVASPNAAASWYSTQPSFGLINLNGGLTYSTGRGVVIADIDSLVDYSHPALAGHLTSSYDFVVERPQGVAILNDSSAGYLDDSSAGYLDTATITYINDSSAGYLDTTTGGYLNTLNPAYSHGTLVAGILAAVAPDAMIMPLRAFDNNGSSDTFAIAKAIRWAVNNGAKVINMSFGTLTNAQVLQTAIAYALAHNVTLVASAGNNNTSAPQYPAAYSGVISTAATNLLDIKAPFSNYGPSINMGAPGVNIISAVPGNLYGIVSGTSFSAPIIAGTAALVLSEGVTSVTNQITSGAVNINAINPAYSGQLGSGRVDVLKSVHPH
jgi:subtilisin family serine protease